MNCSMESRTRSGFTPAAATMTFKPNRARILKTWKPDEGVLLDELPLSYDNTTLRVIEHIDVLWLRRRFIVRAFEVEHKTAVDSGILRMANLVALQPNMNINLHIV